MCIVHVLYHIPPIFAQNNSKKKKMLSIQFNPMDLFSFRFMYIPSFYRFFNFSFTFSFFLIYLCTPPHIRFGPCSLISLSADAVTGHL